MSDRDAPKAILRTEIVAPAPEPRMAGDLPPSIYGPVLLAHVFFTIGWATGQAALFMLPILARRHFGAGDWQTVLITGAVPTLMTAAIFWHEVLRRTSLVRYFLAYWLVGVFPLGLAAWVSDFWSLWGLHLIAAVGASAWSPLSGTLLKRFYADEVRGRAFSLLSITTLVSNLLTAYGIGVWLEHDPEAFRIYMPLSAIAQLVGIGVLIAVAKLHRAAPAAVQTREPLLRVAAALVAPVRSMGATLRADARFRRYEQAFMTYGVGWMICNALLPILGTKHLRLSYDDYATSTQVAMNIGLIAMALPTGWLLDRAGAVRTSALAFCALTIYPLALIFVGDRLQLAIASAAFGVAMAGVQAGWLLGPVALAPRTELVSQYVAIHTTLVGIRGIVAQGIGMFIYERTGSLLWPMLIAAAGFLWSAQQMWSLHQLMAPRTAKAPAPARAGARVT